MTELEEQIKQTIIALTNGVIDEKKAEVITKAISKLIIQFNK